MGEGTDFAEMIRRIQSETGWSQAELADRAGITAATLSRIKGGWQGIPVWDTGRKIEALHQVVSMGIRIGASA